MLNFFITGVLMLAFAIGLRRALRPAFWGSFLIGLVGVGCVASGMFTSDPINGYPPGTPLFPMQTTEGMIHSLSALPVILGWPIACGHVGRRFWKLGQRGWASYSVVTAIAIVVTTGLAGLGLSQTNLALSEVAGAFQRLSVIVGFAWTAFVAHHLMRSLPNRRLLVCILCPAFVGHKLDQHSINWPFPVLFNLARKLPRQADSSQGD